MEIILESWDAWDDCGDYSDMIETIETCSISDRTFQISGSLGLWNGIHDIMPVISKGLMNSINQCLNSVDSFVVNVDEENGRINVSASHHDGTNNFIIKMIKLEKEEELEESNKIDDTFFDKITINQIRG